MLTMREHTPDIVPLTVIDESVSENDREDDCNHDIHHSNVLVEMAVREYLVDATNQPTFRHLSSSQSKICALDMEKEERMK